MTNRLFLAGLAAAAAVAVSLFGGLVGETTAPGAAQASSADQALLTRLVDELATRDTAAYVRGLEQRVAAPRSDSAALALLGFAYQQRARETGDPTFYARSAHAFARAREAGADDGLVATGLAALAVSRHRYRDALPLARRALSLEPENAIAYGALGDALVNLGRYREGFRAFDRMAELSPSVASYARIAYARELIGRPRSATEAAELAQYLDVFVPEHLAAARVQLGTIYFNAGRVAEARRSFARALDELPGYLRAEAGLARVDAAEGRYGAAVPRLRRVVDRLPLPEYAIWLGDALAAAGRKQEAEEAYRLVDAIDRLLAANGVHTELQTALHDLDRGRRLGGALARARLAHERAPSIQSADVLAWALARNGRCAEALPYSKRALRLGTQDALLYFHRGMIERCLGHAAGARAWFRRAVVANPHFSLRWAPVARRYAA